jgi:hypothetical protein
VGIAIVQLLEALESSPESEGWIVDLIIPYIVLYNYSIVIKLSM